nr:U4/U6 small nuclear ribonucleoprotein PRP4-like protein [Ipomoea batatas]
MPVPKPQTVDPPSSRTFQVPSTAIQNQMHVDRFHSSATCKNFIGFVVALSESVRSLKVSDPCRVSPAISTVVSTLQTLISFVDEIPPAPAPKSSRCGNVAYRTWHERMRSNAESYMIQLLPPNFHPYTVELVPYFTDSFGNADRIDYGTGHETHFAAWLYCLARLGVVKEVDYQALVTKVFVKFLELMRKLQLTYSLEPAASHGVWGLDDYHILPFIFGSSQLIGHKYIKPKSIRNEDIVQNFSNEYLYFSCVAFTKEVKKGLLAKHSPILYDTSQVPNWDTVNSGLLKMYKVEVLQQDMDVDEENSVEPTETSSVITDNQNVASALGAISLQPVQPLAPPVIMPPIAPAIAPRPVVAPPLAPLPVRPSVLKPPSVTQNGDMRASDSDSDHDESGSGAMAGSTQEYEISEESKLVRERQEKAMQELLLKRRAAALAVPTNDMAVRARLRRLGEPITFFGEREMERRDRLRALMARLDAEGQLERLMKAHEDEEASASAAPTEEEEIQYPFYTEGSKSLLQARIEIAKYSILKSALRLDRARRKRDDPDEDLDAEIDLALNQAGSLVLDCSEIGDDRPLSGCSLSHDGEMLATCALNGVAKLWSMPQVQKVSTLKGHTERATDVVFSPTSNHLATASADRTARLWNAEGSLLRTFEGHLDRLARIAFHPCGKYLGTTSFDKTWRLWDVETGEELLLQEGHSRSVYGLSFHHDGSLAASCGLDALARVWDLRTGRSILAFEGHVKPVLGISFSPNGYHLATGGEDNTCRIWDLRKRKSLYTIPAHSNLISQVKFESQEGYFLVTASYDMTAKVWSSRDFKPVRTLSGHEAKVTSLDVGADGQLVATVSHDRTIKLWSSKSSEKEKAMDIDYKKPPQQETEAAAEGLSADKLMIGETKGNKPVLEFK